MEKLLHAKGIGVVGDNSPEEEGTFYAYTSDLLKKNVLIKFYNFEIGEDEVETAVHAMFLYKGASYTFYLYHHIDGLPTFPIVLFRVIVDVVEFISTCNPNTLVKDLQQLSSAFSSSLDKDIEEEFRVDYQTELADFNRILGLIELKRSELS